MPPFWNLSLTTSHVLWTSAHVSGFPSVALSSPPPSHHVKMLFISVTSAMTWSWISMASVSNWILIWSLNGCDKTLWLKACGEERVYFSIQFSDHTITSRSQGKNSRQKSGGRNWSSDHGETLLSGLLYSACFHIHLRITPYSDLLLPTSVIKKMPPQACLQGNLVATFSQLRFLLPKWPKLVSRTRASIDTSS